MKNLFWTKQLDGSYRAAPGGHTYTIILEPRPIDRYVAHVDGEVQRAVGGPQAGREKSRPAFYDPRITSITCR